MKKILFLAVSVALMACNGNTAKEENTEVAPVVAINPDGAAYDNQLLLADPFILEDDGWFYIYGTHAKDGIVVYRSKDLRTWSDLCGNATDKLALHKENVWGEFSFWAPEVYKIDGRYLMTFSTEEHICYAWSDSPCGPFVQTEERSYLEEKGIDSHIFIDEDGKAYMFWVRFSKGNVIWVAEMTPDLQTVKLETAQRLIDVQEGTWEQKMELVAEGPMVIKEGGKYYLTYSCNHFQSQDYAVGYAVADSPMGPYTRYEKNPILHRHCGYVGTGHHALFKTGDQYYIVYHAHNNKEQVGPRQTLIAPLNLVEEGDQYRLEISTDVIVPVTETAEVKTQELDSTDIHAGNAQK